MHSTHLHPLSLQKERLDGVEQVRRINHRSVVGIEANAGEVTHHDLERAQ